MQSIYIEIQFQTQRRVNSLDPRVNRLPNVGQQGVILPKEGLDQFGTFEVFVQPKQGKPFQHEGIVHAPNLEMAFILAKETFTRRFTCVSLCVCDTGNVFVSPFTEGNQNAYSLFDDATGSASEAPTESYEIFHLFKRGKQHVHGVTMKAFSALDAISRAKNQFKDQPVLNIWVLKTVDIRFTGKDEEDLWLTLPEKRFRDAADYKGGEKLKAFLERRQS